MPEGDLYKEKSLSDEIIRLVEREDFKDELIPVKKAKKSIKDLSDSIDEKEKLSDEGKHTAGFREGVKHACKVIRNELKRIMGPRLI